MTPRERAEWALCRIPIAKGIGKVTVENLDIIEQAIAEAVAERQEACAALADRYAAKNHGPADQSPAGWHAAGQTDAGVWLAAAIRAMTG